MSSLSAREGTFTVVQRGAWDGFALTSRANGILVCRRDIANRKETERIRIIYIHLPVFVYRTNAVVRTPMKAQGDHHFYIFATSNLSGIFLPTSKRASSSDSCAVIFLFFIFFSTLPPIASLLGESRGKGQLERKIDRQSRENYQHKDTNERRIRQEGAKLRNPQRCIEPDRVDPQRIGIFCRPVSTAARRVPFYRAAAA